MAQFAVVKRPPVLWLVGLALACAVAALGVGLWRLSAARAALPAVVAIDKAGLEEALNDAPWASSRGDGGGADNQSDNGGGDDDDDENDAPVLWLIASPGCAACEEFVRTAMPHLLDAGVEIRAIPYAPRALPANGRAAQDVAAVIKQRDWAALDLWMQGKHETTEPLEPAEQDGMLEWSRQSAERIAAIFKRNEMEFGAPMLIWRNGPEWRAVAKARPPSFREIERELAPKA